MSENELIRTEPQQHGALADLRSGMMLLPAERMQEALAEFDERRKVLRDYLLSKLVQGVHFGVPPGCEPRGNTNPAQWKHKPSLYKAGAETVCELMGVRSIFTTDLDAWKQLGEPKGTFVIKCVLVSQSTGQQLGEGLGCFKVGEKKMQENAAIKMAEKRAKVDAVLNAYGLSDLFTQDLEEPPEYDNPEHDGNAPQSQPRNVRVSKDECKALFDRWVMWRASSKQPADPHAFEGWVSGVTGMTCELVGKPSSWKREDMANCNAALDQEERDAAAV